MSDASASPKKPSAKKPGAPKKIADHPKYANMIIVALKERKISSRQAIVKYIKANYNVVCNVASLAAGN